MAFLFTEEDLSFTSMICIFTSVFLIQYRLYSPYLLFVHLVGVGAYQIVSRPRRRDRTSCPRLHVSQLCELRSRFGLSGVPHDSVRHDACQCMIYHSIPHTVISTPGTRMFCSGNIIYKTFVTETFCNKRSPFSIASFSK